MPHLAITVYGKVQGVSFRAATKAVADQLGIKGFVRNLPEGTVYMEAEGDDFSMESFLEWCHQGPDLAKVEKVETKEGDFKKYNNFVVTRKMWM